MVRLLLLNAWRWFKEYAVSWGVLSVIYSLTVSLLLQPILEQAFRHEFKLSWVWSVSCLLLLLPGVLEWMRLPPFKLVKAGFFNEAIWVQKGSPLLPLYLRHDLRRGPTWLALTLAVALGGVLPENKRALWILVAQLPVQRALYSLTHWKRVALTYFPNSGAQNLVVSFGISQLIQALIASLAFAGTVGLSIEQTALYLNAMVAMVVTSSALILEGDAGRPWLVNFFVLAGATLAGYLTLAFPITVLFVVYFWTSMRGAVKKRLFSVEHLDEDTVIP